MVVKIQSNLLEWVVKFTTAHMLAILRKFTPIWLSYNISKKINNISDLKGFVLKDLSSKEKNSKKLRKRIYFVGQSILKNIYLETKKIYHKS